MKFSLPAFRILIFLFLCPPFTAVQAQEHKKDTPDSIRISLLTCASGEEI